MIGIDITPINRFEKHIKNKNYLKKYLCDDEIKLVNSAQSAAGFFASKEAISKALMQGIGKECSFFDIKIHKTDKNAPYFTLSQKLVQKYKIKNTSLSISHDGGFAIAVAFIESDLEENLPISH